ncbi:hypothetical protein LZ30DRAFT_769621 [Colletotrichum cereale]|nr:hypothetical protein LZ30DRAFT_769621 [Colletotrichum cereale]
MAQPQTHHTGETSTKSTRTVERRRVVAVGLAGHQLVAHSLGNQPDRQLVRPPWPHRHTLGFRLQSRGVRPVGIRRLGTWKGADASIDGRSPYEFASEPLRGGVFGFLGLDDSSDEVFNRSFSERFLPWLEFEGPWLTRFLEWNVEDRPSADAYDRVKYGITNWDWRRRGMLEVEGGDSMHLGVARREMAQLGDILCVFRGIQVPVVLGRIVNDDCWSSLDM